MMEYKITLTDGSIEIVEAEECRTSGGGIFKKDLWYDFGEYRLKPSALSVGDTYFAVSRRFNIDHVGSVEVKEDE